VAIHPHLESGVLAEVNQTARNSDIYSAE